MLLCGDRQKPLVPRDSVCLMEGTCIDSDLMMKSSKCLKDETACSNLLSCSVVKVSKRRRSFDVSELDKSPGNV